MDDTEMEILRSMRRSPADRAEVLTGAVRQNMKFGQFEMVAIAMQEVASAAWGVAGGDVEPVALRAAAEKALGQLDTQTSCSVERVMLREVIDQASTECTVVTVPDDPFVTGPECLLAHMADLETESEI